MCYARKHVVVARKTINNKITLRLLEIDGWIDTLMRERVSEREREREYTLYKQRATQCNRK